MNLRAFLLLGVVLPALPTVCLAQPDDSRVAAWAVLGITSVPGGYRLIDTAGTIHNFGAAHGPASFGANDAPYVGIS